MFLKAKLAAVRGLPAVVRKRSAIQRTRTVAARAIEQHLERRWLSAKVREKHFDVRLASAMTTPRVSAILVNYNAGLELRRALQSIADELAGSPWEAVVVDNGSSDGSAAIVDEMRAAGAPSPQRRKRRVCPGHESGAGGDHRAARADHESGLPPDAGRARCDDHRARPNRRAAHSSDLVFFIPTARFRAVLAATRTC